MDCVKLTFHEAHVSLTSPVEVELGCAQLPPDKPMDTSSNPKRLKDQCYRAWSLVTLKDKPVPFFVSPARDWLVERTEGVFTLNGMPCDVEFFETA